MLKDVKERLRYQIDDIFSGGSLTQLILLIILSLIVVLLGMTAFYFGLFSPRNQGVVGIGGEIDRGFWDSLWWSLKHLIDPGVFADNYGASGAVILVSLLISVMGMVIFGILIGFISTSMETRLASLQEGNSPVIESGHVLILGWSNKIAPILRLLSVSLPEVHVVILGRPRVMRMKEALRTEGVPDLPLKVILRSGDPTNFNELHRVAFAHAKSIVVLAGRTRDTDASGSDVEAIKTAMLLSGFDGWAARPPSIVSEISRKHNVDIARIAGRHKLSIVSTSEVISKIIVQAARQPGVSKVYSDILSPGGNSIQVASVDACIGKPFGEIVYQFPDAIPIGICWAEEAGEVQSFAAGLNPEPDYIINRDDHIVLLSRQGSVDYRASIRQQNTGIERNQEAQRDGGRSVLVFGFNDNVYDIVNELDGHLAAGSRIHLVSNYAADDVRCQLDRYAAVKLGNVELEFSRGDTVSEHFLKSLDVASYNCVITLADESHGDDPDARSIMSLLLLSDLLGDVDRPRPHVVSEILDAGNRDLISRTAAQDIVVSPEIVSMQLGQVSQQPVLESIFTELLSAGGFEICLKPAARYIKPGAVCRFDDLQYAAQQHLEIAIGVRTAGSADSGHGVHLNPHRDASWQFGNDDMIVVLAQELYD